MIPFSSKIYTEENYFWEEVLFTGFMSEWCIVDNIFYFKKLFSTFFHNNKFNFYKKGIWWTLS